MLKLLILLICLNLVSCTCGPQQTIINEGKKLCCYYDTKGIPTIGVGFNLRRQDASTVLSKYNLTLSKVLEDCQKSTKKSCLTDKQATDIFNVISYPEAAACVDRYVPNLPSIKRAAIIDVAFAGCATLNQFINMKNALINKNWKKAGDELKSSAWCRQVGVNRCNSDYNCITDSCSGETCGSYTKTCSSNSNCYCFKMSNGTGFCSADFYCSQYRDCTSCPSSTSVCLISTCCRTPICVPLSLGATCRSSSTSRNLKNDQTFFKYSNEKTATGH